MDIAVLAQWFGSAGGVLLALSVAFRERSKRAALQAERELESERQESRAQEHTLARLRALEARMETQAQHIANLIDENREQAKKLAHQDAIIGRQASLIGDLQRANRQLAEQARAAEGRASASAREMADLRRDIMGSRDKPSALPDDLYNTPLPRPPKLPKLPKV